jgi:hypothetical protein
MPRDRPDSPYVDLSLVRGLDAPDPAAERRTLPRPLVILDLREGGTIWADDEVLQRDGRFVHDG